MCTGTITFFAVRDGEFNLVQVHVEVIPYIHQDWGRPGIDDGSDRGNGRMGRRDDLVAFLETDSPSEWFKASVPL